ncbi:MAG TPA: sulfite exporter TauE/SafE family protein [Actinomycetota bacterium]|nr:sulfite exporter TauE/SafE family protein [Actinomycetota bacterium]
MSIDPFLTLGGLFAGMVVGLTGLGGAAIVTPMLLLIFNVPPPIAVSTDVVSAAVMKPVGAGVHIKRHTPHYSVVLWLCMGSVPGVLLGTWLFSVLVEGEGGDHTLRKMIGVVLLVAVVVTLLRLRLRRYAEAHGQEPLRFSRGKLAVTAAVGFLVGTLVGLTSVGSGTLIAAGLMIVFPAMLPSRLVGTDLVQAVPMLAVGALAHAGLGEIDTTVLFSLLLGQIPGVFVGARISSRYNGQELRWLLLVLVGSAGLALLGVPSWIATTITIGGVLLLGVPIIVRHRRATKATDRTEVPARDSGVP